MSNRIYSYVLQVGNLLEDLVLIKIICNIMVRTPEMCQPCQAIMTVANVLSKQPAFWFQCDYDVI